MASKRAVIPARHLFNGFKSCSEAIPSTQVRCMATEAPLPNATLSRSYIDAHLESAPTTPVLEDNFSIPPPAASSRGSTTQPIPFQPQQNPFLSTAQCLLYNFPSLEPVRFAYYPSTHLLLPTRRDLLHKAVIYEGDMTRQGTASTKWRSEVHGSGRKIRPQKGTGSARLGDKKSPMLRGGGVAFGPKPRNFSTELPRKMYDIAVRTALSYRYRKGELIVTDSEIEVQGVHEKSLERFTSDILRWNGLSKTLFVTNERREGLFSALEGKNMDRQARAKEVQLVDVKDLLEGGRVCIERTSLEWLFERHESDLGPRQKLLAWAETAPDAPLEAGQDL